MNVYRLPAEFVVKQNDRVKSKRAILKTACVKNVNDKQRNCERKKQRVERRISFVRITIWLRRNVPTFSRVFVQCIVQPKCIIVCFSNNAFFLYFTHTLQEKRMSHARVIRHNEKDP